MVKKENKNDKGPVVSVDGAEMLVRDLNENQRYLYHQMEDLTRKQFTAQSELDQINAALSVFKNAFVNSTKEQADEVLSDETSEGEE